MVVEVIEVESKNDVRNNLPLTTDIDTFKDNQQKLMDDQKFALNTAYKFNDDSNNTAFDNFLFYRYRKYFALLIPFLISHFIWWSLAIKNNYFALYPTHWEMPVTMVIGATIAGMTSEGGGAVAFPVMTFVLGLAPETARDFSIMIQSTGMSIALCVIVLMQIQLEFRAIIFAMLGAIPGILFGLYAVDPFLDRPVKKMIFVSVWGSFAISLWILNSERKRRTFDVIQFFSIWKAIVLVIGGFIGAIFTSFAGSGVDICVFSILTLLFRVTEKIATPTTVVLMALTSQFCFFWRQFMMDGISEIAWNYLKASAPIAVTFAPIGCFIGSHFHRQTLACFVYILEAFSYIGFLTNPNLLLILVSFCILLIGYLIFRQLRIFGEKLMQENEVQSNGNAM